MVAVADFSPPPASSADAELVLGLLRRTHLSTAAELPRVVAEQAEVIGATGTRLYLVDHEQEQLISVELGADGERESLSVTGTVAGRAYSTISMITASDPASGTEQLWVPLLDGTERLGVMEMNFQSAPDEALQALCERYAHLVAMLVMSKGHYSDLFEFARRREPMTIASELVQSVAPPLVFATEGLTVAGMLEPAYDNGGDALDYALNDNLLHFAVFDAMGHGLAAAGLAAFAIAAYRHSRRSGSDLLETYEAMDEAVGAQFPDQRFVTAMIAQLDIETGLLRWVSAGHPPPLRVRGGRHASLLDTTPASPLGVTVGLPAPPVAEMSLEPGDLVLLYTDGLTEARGADGDLFTIERLKQFIEREAVAGRAAPETLRRLRMAILTSGRAELRDDATALLIEWQRGTERQVMPQTVLKDP
jgi:serine/threonine protein phosphatase PrpC